MTTDSGEQGGDAGAAAGEINPLTGEAAAPPAGAGGGDGAGDQGGGGEPPAWWNDLSADAPDEKTLSDRAWIENKKYADLATLIKATRGLESQLGGEKLPVPKGADDKEGWDRIFKALGRPDAPDGYKFDAFEKVDPKLTGAFAPIAHQLGMNQAMVDGVVAFNEEMVAQQAKEMQLAHAAEVQQLRKDMGSEFDTALERSLRAAERFGLDKPRVDAMRQAIGPKALITMLDTIGKAIGEDGMVGGGKRDMVMTAERAAARKAEILADPKAQEALRNKQPAAVAEWKAIAEAMAEQQQQRAA